MIALASVPRSFASVGMPDDELIRLPRRFVLTIYGDTERWLHSSVPYAEMVYALTRLFSGRPAAQSTFDRWLMTVVVEPDTDGGPEGPTD